MIDLGTKIRELPVTKARKNFTQILEHIETDEMIVLVKNYQPKAVLVSPSWFDQFPSLLQIREKIWGRHTGDIAQALNNLINQPQELLPKLLRS